MNITEFLEARIAEDEALAREAIADDMGQDGGFEDAFDRLTGRSAYGFVPRFADAAARMIVWNTPRRVLAECAAKRAIIEEAGFDTSLHTLRALAAVYADHPDYRQEWSG